MYKVFFGNGVSEIFLFLDKQRHPLISLCNFKAIQPKLRSGPYFLLFSKAVHAFLKPFAASLCFAASGHFAATFHIFAPTFCSAVCSENTQ